jgi:hypothetical protein
MTTTATHPTRVHAAPIRQYTTAGAVKVWAAAALPMGALAWIGAPLLAAQLEGPGTLARR